MANTEPTRREFLKVTSAAAAAASLGIGGVTAPMLSCRLMPGDSPRSPKRPNFVIFLCDDLGYGDLSCYGHPVIRTPNLDNLAATGMKLTDCYAAAPVCSPARAGMLTGRTPYRAGIYDWIPQGSPMHLMRSEITAATLLRSVGYATCHSGKWHCSGTMDGSQPTPGDHGFDHWFSTQNNARPSHHDPRNFYRNGEQVGPLTGYSSTLIVEEAIRWLGSRRQDQPFALFIWFHSPHEPVATAEEFVRMYPKVDHANRAIYYGNVTQMDHEVGRLLAALDAMGLRDDTLVMFTSDNGPETLNRYRGAERSYGSPGPLRGMKLHLYEGGIRVAGIIRWPGHTRRGQVCREPINGTDVLPTLCELARVAPPADRAIDGASIVPIFEGRSIERTVPLYWQYDRAIGRPKVAMRQGNWKILAHKGLAEFELYNLEDDIGEKRDLAAKEPQRFKAMADRLGYLYRAVRAEGPTWPARNR